MKAVQRLRAIIASMASGSASGIFSLRLPLLAVAVLAGCGDVVPGPVGSVVALDTPAVRIGAADGAQEYLFEHLEAVIIMPGGGIVVVDRAPRVALFGAEGEWRGELSRAGEGPGEVKRPSGVWAWSDDTVAVWDAAQRKIVLLPIAGGAGRDARIMWAGGPRPADGAGRLAVVEMESGQAADTLPASSRLIRLAAIDSVTIVPSYPVPEYGWAVPAGSRSGHMVSPPIFAVWPSWDVSAAGVWWLDGVSPEVRLIDWSGAVSKRIALDLVARPVTDDDRRAHYAGLEKRYGLPQPADVTLEPFASTIPIVTRIVADDAGCLWLGGFDSSADLSHGWTASRYTIVRTDDGVHLGTVTFPRGFRLSDVRAGRAAGITEDDDGLHFTDIFDTGDICAH